jgi:hypothetical protein
MDNTARRQAVGGSEEAASFSAGFRRKPITSRSSCVNAEKGSLLSRLYHLYHLYHLCLLYRF